MNLKTAKALRPGDGVKWNDPDEGRCSRHLIIQEVRILGNFFRNNVAVIMDTNGDCLECFIEELE
jgi:hypothetical protein